MFKLILFIIFPLISTQRVPLPDLQYVKPIDRVFWTNNSLPLEGKAFGDILMEKLVQSFFEKFVAKVKDPKIDGEQILQDPMPIRKGIDVTKSGTAYEIRFTADDIMAHGLGDLKINYLKVSRRFGLKDLRANLTVSTDLKLDGRYKLEGKALGLIPVHGDGGFTIDVMKLKFYAHTFLAFDKEGNQLLLKDLDIEVRYDDLDFQFNNLMGGGIVGNTLNAIINVVGEEIIRMQKGHIMGVLRDAFHEILTKYL